MAHPIAFASTRRHVRTRAAARVVLVAMAMAVVAGLVGLDVPAASAASPGAPAAPTLLPAAGSILASWNPPTNDGGSPITGYRLAFTTNPSFSSYSYMALGPNVRQQVIPGLTAGTTYYVRVAADNATGQGTLSASSSTVPVTTAVVPIAPATPKVFGVMGGLRVRWSPPTSTGGQPIVGYRIILYPAGGSMFRIDTVGAVTSADVTGLSPGQYVVQVAAVTAVGMGASSGYASNAALASFAPVCTGTGDDGPRVQIVYAYATTPDATMQSSVVGQTGLVDAFFARSATATGGVRNVRWRTTSGAAGCQITVTPLAIPASTTSKSQVDAALATAGLDQVGRKYYVWIDDTTITGFADGCVSSVQADDSPGQANLSNTRMGTSMCPLSWGGGFGPPHELAHQLGAVQASAPHSDGGFHCVEANDPVCFGHTTFTNPACADQNLYLSQFDCGFDDYWNTNPLAGSYLCTHWNTARSAFLTHNLDEQQLHPPGTPTATAGDGVATVSWTPPSAAGCDTLTGYRVTAQPGGATLDVGAGSNAAVFSGLTNGTAYTFTVTGLWATAGTGPTSAASNSVRPGPPSSAPTFHALQPSRILDTRAATSVGLTGVFTAGQTRTLQVAGHGGVPANGATAVVLNVTGVLPTADTFVTLWPSGASKPGTSSLNLARGQVTPNLVYVKLSADGQVDLFNNSGDVDLLGDVVGWFDGDGSGDRFIGVQPTRLLDTRPESTVGLSGAFGPGQTRTLAVAGKGPVPATGVSAVVVNVTPVNPTASSFVTLWPSGATRPTTSNLNLSSGAITPNLVTVKLSSTGAVDLYNNSGTTDLLADVVGYYTTTGGGFVGLQPARILDTRPGTTAGLSGKFAAAQTRTLQVAGTGGVPASGATAVVLNVTAVLPNQPSFLTLWPSGAARPTTSNLNLATGTVRPNLVIVRLSATGAVDIFNNSGSTDVLADVVGYFT